MDDQPLKLGYDRGTVTLSGGPPDFDFTQLPGVLFDSRTSEHRAEGRHYRAIVEFCLANKLKFEDQARAWANQPVGWTMQDSRSPHPHQLEAVATWTKAGRRGVVVLPTGTGKTFVAILCIERVSRPTLVVTPTLELMRQWHSQLAQIFGIKVGAVGGGDYDFQPLTVTTYDSAYIHVERWAHRYGLVVFDECHHLPGASMAQTAVGALAPFRLGLTATPERADAGELLLPQLIGPIVYRREITELSGDYLAQYQTRREYVDLTPEELETYQACRDEYRRFVEERQISLSDPSGWKRFLFEASRSPEGWSALRSYRQLKRIERAASGKFACLEQLMLRHAGERMLIFTADNATVYQIARQYLVPAITHQTKTKERKRILEGFHQGDLTVLVTSQVLNEGVDVPAASVGVVLSGSGSIKENVQRLGRILRKYGSKQAVLYEIVARGTAEEFTSERRRQHRAFQ